MTKINNHLKKQLMRTTSKQTNTNHIFFMVSSTSACIESDFSRKKHNSHTKNNIQPTISLPNLLSQHCETSGSPSSTVTEHPNNLN